MLSSASRHAQLPEKKGSEQHVAAQSPLEEAVLGKCHLPLSCFGLGMIHVLEMGDLGPLRLSKPMGPSSSPGWALHLLVTPSLDAHCPPHTVCVPVSPSLLGTKHPGYPQPLWAAARLPTTSPKMWTWVSNPTPGII